MRKVIFTLLVIALVIAKTGHSQTVDCNYVFTDLERAICSNEELHELDQELESLLALAVSTDAMSIGAVHEMRNQLAVRCGASDNVVACLIAREQEAIGQLAMLTEPRLEIAASYRPEDVPEDNYESLKSKLAEAESLSLDKGRAQRVVTSTVALLEIYRGHGASHLSFELREFEVLALESRLRAGCRNLRQRRYWQRELKAHGRSCGRSPRHEFRG